MVLMKTTLGDITVELYADKAPVTVENFLRYTDEKFYDGTIFHRVIETFVIQGGGWTKEMVRKETHEPIVNEANNAIGNTRGTIAMARMQDPNSATSQFFINVNDNARLDYFDEATPGYCVFGRVVEGMDVVDKIRKVRTGPMNPLPRDVPIEPVEILSIARIGGEETAPTAEAEETD
ncbi:MAG: peptidylprolyl isomerase [Candidatus Eisenbacteria bacterium]|nr:peptidylprolyl isomerase [Candidatus Eisenbacteria bacterium]